MKVLASERAAEAKVVMEGLPLFCSEDREGWVGMCWLLRRRMRIRRPRPPEKGWDDAVVSDAMIVSFSPWARWLIERSMMIDGMCR